MNMFLSVMDNFSLVTLILLTICVVGSVFVFKYLKVYLERDPSWAKFITVKVLRVWKQFNIWACLIVLSLIILKIASVGLQTNEDMKAASLALLEKQEVKEVVAKPVIKTYEIDKDMFFKCLEISKSKAGLDPTQIKACQDAATVELNINQER